MARRWTLEEGPDIETDEGYYVWTNITDPRLTVNIHTALGELEDEEGNWYEDAYTFWYVYPAYDGIGLPASPDISDSEKEAKRDAGKYLRMSNADLLAIGERDSRLMRPPGRRPEVHVQSHPRKVR